MFVQKAKRVLGKDDNVEGNPPGTQLIERIENMYALVGKPRRQFVHDKIVQGSYKTDVQSLGIGFVDMALDESFDLIGFGFDFLEGMSHQVDGYEEVTLPGRAEPDEQPQLLVDSIQFL